MQPLTKTTVGKLIPGDTFFKEKYGKEIIYTVMELRCSTPGKKYVMKGSLRMTDIADNKEDIIFLKHKEK